MRATAAGSGGGIGGGRHRWNARIAAGANAGAAREDVATSVLWRRAQVRRQRSGSGGGSAGRVEGGVRFSHVTGIAYVEVPVVR